MKSFTYLAGPATRKAAHDAITVQDASNLLGILKAFQAHTEAIWREQQLPSDDLRRHPVVRLFMDKLGSLTGDGQFLSIGMYEQAEAACKRLAEGEDVSMHNGNIVSLKAPTFPSGS